MAILVADTDVLIDSLQGRAPIDERIPLGLEAGTLATTAVSVFELLSGAPSDHAREQTERLLSALPVLPFDAEAAEIAARVRRVLEARGTPIGMADYQIAGICLARSAALLTRNRKHFTRIPELRIA